MNGLVQFLFYFAMVALAISLLIAVLMFATSPYSFNKADCLKPDAQFFMTHTTSGAQVNLNYASSNLVPHMLKPNVRNAQMDLLTRLTRVLTQSRIEHWAVKTTLLAAVRHGQLIPWDDTISIAILHDKFVEFVSLRPKLTAEAKTLLIATKHGYLFCVNNATRFPCIEICLMKKKDHEVSICTPTDEIAQCSFQDSFLRRREVYTTDKVFPLQVANIGSVAICIPNKARECLDVYCGKGWETDPLWNRWKLIANNQSMGMLQRLRPTF